MTSKQKKAFEIRLLDQVFVKIISCICGKAAWLWYWQTKLTTTQINRKQQKQP